MDHCLRASVNYASFLCVFLRRKEGRLPATQVITEYIKLVSQQLNQTSRIQLFGKSNKILPITWNGVENDECRVRNTLFLYVCVRRQSQQKTAKIIGRGYNKAN